MGFCPWWLGEGDQSVPPLRSPSRVFAPVVPRELFFRDAKGVASATERIVDVIHLLPVPAVPGWTKDFDRPWQT